ncbi:T9SS type B sorting domain-containing protein [Dyadobacter arcticus]|uniref:Gliding motility-associated-like protein n=1 Tax=Dyadobacter arcticus TaxID=1078754 RepID=A0ABX0UUM3_9BACT|nr:gliding motility-associated C-terminal domain-containing protein [Dyadobacter arcticus]NIJ55919.1 gliding motility-associated-like protein [Dyadobacter arcticus]
MNIKLLIAFLLGSCLLLPKNVSGQFCGSTGGFSITPAQGCAPLTVKLNNLVPRSESVSYAFNFDRSRTTVPDIKETTQDSSYIYQLAGTYTILQFGSAGGTGFSQCNDVIVKETRGPKAELITCQNGRARLTLPSDSISNAYDAIEINWGDGSRQSVSAKGSKPLYLDHFYSPGSGVPSVKVQGKYSGGDCEQELATTTLMSNTGSGSFKNIRIRSVEMLASGEAKILYEGMEGVPTEVLIDKGDGQFVSTGKAGQTGGPQSATIGNLNPGQIYRFKLSSEDFCDNRVESPIVSSLILKEGSFALDEIISVGWENQPNTETLIEYQLKRDGVVIFTSADQLFYLDKDVKCGITYKYEIVAIIENDVRSYSAPFSIQPKTSSPAVISVASVTVEDENTIITNVEISGEGLTSTYDLIVERAPLGSTNYTQVSPPDNGSLQYQDSKVNTSENAYCYRFEYKNACNLRSPEFSQSVCSILLKSNTSEISWTDDIPFTDALGGYDLIELDNGGSVTNIIPKQTSTNHTLDLGAQTEFSFQIEAKSADGKFVSKSNILNVRQEAIVLIPDAFTPNGDAHNERFEVKGYFISKFKMSVFDRWGEVVFHSTDIRGSWDGKIKNENGAGGQYLYKIEAMDASGRVISKNGTFLLIR